MEASQLKSWKRLQYQSGQSDNQTTYNKQPLRYTDSSLRCRDTSENSGQIREQGIDDDANDHSGVWCFFEKIQM
jgi:hypothetical protein